MTTCLRYPKGYQFFDGNGAPLAIASLTYFQAGTTTLQNTYSDSVGTIPNANPIVLDASGRLLVDVYLGSVANYKEVLTASTGAIVSPWPADNIPCAGSSTSSGTNTNLSATYTSTNVNILSSTGSSASLASATETYAGILTASDKLKLDGIASGAQVQPTSAQIVSSIDTQLGNTGWRSDMTGDSGSGGTHGLVPAPAAGTAAAGKFLKADGTWAAIPSGGVQVHNVADANYTAASTDKVIAYTSLTAARTVTLAAASSLTAGTRVLIIDQSGTCSATNTITTSAAGSDTIDGLSTAVINTAYGALELMSNGSNAWTLITFPTVNADWNATSGSTKILNKPASFTPSAHASTHASGGSDPISIAASQVSGIAASLASQNLDNIGRLGINTTDTGNKLSVSAPSVLFSNSGDMRATISKGASTNTAAFNFQDNFSTRVQFGLLGNDNFTVSTSPDGSTFNNAIVATTAGIVSFPNTGGFTGDSGSGGSVGLVPAPAAGTAAAGKFLKADGTWSLPPSTPPGGSSGQFQLNNGSGGFSGLTLSGDATVNTSTGAVTIGANAVSNAKLAQMAANTIKGNNTGSTTNAADLTSTQARLLLRIDQHTTVSDANYSALSSDTFIAYTSITAARTVTLPAANSVNTGQGITIVDESGNCSTTNTITISRAGSDTLNGATSVTINSAYSYIEVVSNGSNGWVVVDNGSLATTVLSNKATTFTKQQVFGTATLTDGATISWDVSSAQVATLTLGGNHTMNAPSNLVSGGIYTLMVKQDSTGSRTLTWNSVFKWPAALGAPVLSTAANAIDIFSFFSDGTNLYGVPQYNFQ